jgi:hypothetical protein
MKCPGANDSNIESDKPTERLLIISNAGTARTEKVYEKLISRI